MLTYRFMILLKMVFLVIFLGACSDGFTTSFEEIEHDKLRPLAFVFDNPDMAPGDTVRFHGYFAGLPLDGNFKCSLAVNVQTSAYGKEFISGRVPIDDYLIEADDHPVIQEDDYISFSFIVPENILATSGSLPSGTRDEFLGFVEQFLIETDFSQTTDEMQKLAALMAQLSTVKMFFLLDVNNGALMAERELAVRYNSKINNNPYVKINNNPQINWVGLYKVKLKKDDRGNEIPIVYFTPEDIKNEYSFQYVYLAEDYQPCKEADFDQTVVVEDGYAYFFEADSGFNCNVRTRDTGMIVSYSERQLESLLSAFGTGDFSDLDDLSNFDISFTEVNENYYFDYFFQQDKDEIENVKISNQMNVIGTVRENVETLVVPKDKKITQAEIWVKVQDWILGERIRPFGSDFVKFEINFEHK